MISTDQQGPATHLKVLCKLLQQQTRVICLGAALLHVHPQQLLFHRTFCTIEYIWMIHRELALRAVNAVLSCSSWPTAVVYEQNTG